MVYMVFITRVYITVYITNFKRKRVQYRCIPSAAYHQSPNRQPERYLQTVNRGLKSNSKKIKLYKKNCLMFFNSHRFTAHTATARTPSEMVVGRNLKTRINLIKP